jgi:hypothetical protein
LSAFTRRSSGGFILFAERNGSHPAAQIKTFEDTWHWDKVSAAVDFTDKFSIRSLESRVILKDNWETRKKKGA